jgi:hypothetical protein
MVKMALHMHLNGAGRGAIMTLRMLAAWIEQHGCTTKETPDGIAIGIVWCRKNEEDGSMTLGTEWSQPVRTLVQAARELGY